jgi:acyl carrier protein
MGQVTVERAIDFLYEISGVADIGPDTRFGELGLDSLAVIEWITNLEDELGADLEVKGIDFQRLGGHSVTDVLDLIHQHVAVR